MAEMSRLEGAMLMLFVVALAMAVGMAMGY
jgi:hypothetical protein